MSALRKIARAELYVEDAAADLEEGSAIRAEVVEHAVALRNLALKLAGQEVGAKAPIETGATTL